MATQTPAQKAVAQNQTVDQFAVSSTPFHTHNGNDSANVSYTVLINRSHFLFYRIVAPATANTVATKIGGNIVMPFSGNFVTFNGYVDTAGVTGSMTIDILLNGSSVFTNNQVLSISTGSTKTGIYNLSFKIKSFKMGDILTFSVLTVQTTAAFGLTMQLRVTETSQ